MYLVDGKNLALIDGNWVYGQFDRHTSPTTFHLLYNQIYVDLDNVISLFLFDRFYCFKVYGTNKGNYKMTGKIFFMWDVQLSKWEKKKLKYREY